MTDTATKTDVVVFRDSEYGALTVESQRDGLLVVNHGLIEANVIDAALENYATPDQRDEGVTFWRARYGVHPAGMLSTVKREMRSQGYESDRLAERAIFTMPADAANSPDLPVAGRAPLVREAVDRGVRQQFALVAAALREGGANVAAPTVLYHRRPNAEMSYGRTPPFAVARFHVGSPKGATSLREAVMDALDSWRSYVVKASVSYMAEGQYAVEVGLALPHSVCEAFMDDSIPTFSAGELHGARSIVFHVSKALTEEERRDIEALGRSCTGCVSLQVEGDEVTAQVPGGFVGNYAADSAMNERLSWLARVLEPWNPTLLDIGGLEEVNLKPASETTPLRELGEHAEGCNHGQDLAGYRQSVVTEEEDGGYEVPDHGLPPEVNTILTQFVSVKQHLWDTPQMQGAMKKAKKLVKDKHGKEIADEFTTKLDIARATACESIEIDEAGRIDRSAHKLMMKQAYAKRGSFTSDKIDPDEYPPIPGMEGPFKFRDGRIAYYDPSEKGGRYYDRKTDLYMDRDDMMEGQRSDPNEGGLDENLLTRAAMRLFKAMQKRAGTVGKVVAELSLVAKQLEGIAKPPNSGPMRMARSIERDAVATVRVASRQANESWKPATLPQVNESVIATILALPAMFLGFIGTISFLLKSLSWLFKKMGFEKLSKLCARAERTLDDIEHATIDWLIPAEVSYQLYKVMWKRGWRLTAKNTEIGKDAGSRQRQNERQAPIPFNDYLNHHKYQRHVEVTAFKIIAYTVALFGIYQILTAPIGKMMAYASHHISGVGLGLGELADDTAEAAKRGQQIAKAFGESVNESQVEPPPFKRSSGWGFAPGNLMNAAFDLGRKARLKAGGTAGQREADKAWAKRKLFTDGEDPDIRDSFYDGWNTEDFDIAYDAKNESADTPWDKAQLGRTFIKAAGTFQPAHSATLDGSDTEKGTDRPAKDSKPKNAKDGDGDDTDDKAKGDEEEKDGDEDGGTTEESYVLGWPTLGGMR